MSLLKFGDFLNEVNLVQNQNLSSIVSRTDMPQVTDDVLNMLGSYFSTEQVKLDVDGLKGLRTIQTHIDMDKVKSMTKSPIIGQIFISSDGYIVDGHHRAAAAIACEQPLECIKINSDILSIMAKVKEFNDGKA